MKPKYWTIFILASAAIIASLFYYLRQPAAYSGPIVAPHMVKVQSQATTTPSVANDLQGWQTYANSQYNFQFSYPPDLYVKPAGGVLFNLQSTPNELVIGGLSNQNTGSGYEISAKVLNKSVLDSLISQMSQGGDFVKMSLRLDSINATRYELTSAFVNGPFVVISNPADSSDNVILSYASSNLVCNAQEVCIDTQAESVFSKILSTFQFTTPTPLATSSPTTQVQNDISGWQTYVNSQYGFSFENPSTTQIAVYTNGKLTSGNENDYGLNVGLYSYDYFNWTLNDGTSEEALKYNQAAKQWQVSLGTNEQASDAFCPEAETTNPQQVPYYQIGDFRTGRDWDFAYVTTKGIIVLTELDGSIPNGVDPAEVKFDNPTDVLKVTCNIK